MVLHMAPTPLRIVLLLLVVGVVAAGTCGDGIQDAGEQCDDGNLVPGDGCDCDGTGCPYMGYDNWFASCIEDGWKCELNSVTQPMICRQNVMTCVTCPAGQYAKDCTKSSPGACTPCPEGTFKDQDSASTSCTVCKWAGSKGMYRKDCGGASAGQVLPCPEGTHQPGFVGAGLKACLQCPAGKHSGLAVGASECNDCGQTWAAELDAQCAPAAAAAEAPAAADTSTATKTCGPKSFLNTDASFCVCKVGNRVGNRAECPSKGSQCFSTSQPWPKAHAKVTVKMLTTSKKSFDKLHEPFVAALAAIAPGHPNNMCFHDISILSVAEDNFGRRTSTGGVQTNLIVEAEIVNADLSCIADHITSGDLKIEAQKRDLPELELVSCDVVTTAEAEEAFKAWETSHGRAGLSQPLIIGLAVGTVGGVVLLLVVVKVIFVWWRSSKLNGPHINEVETNITAPIAPGLQIVCGDAQKEQATSGGPDKVQAVDAEVHHFVVHGNVYPPTAGVGQVTSAQRISMPGSCMY